jgi:hypothetical protein
VTNAGQKKICSWPSELVGERGPHKVVEGLYCYILQTRRKRANELQVCPKFPQLLIRSSGKKLKVRFVSDLLPPLQAASTNQLEKKSTGASMLSLR